MGKVEEFDDEEQIVNPEMIFTDRDNPRRVFWNVYDMLGKDEFYVINYHGFGGIGKSRLCAYLNDCIRSGKHPETQEKISSKSLILNFEDLKNNCEKINVLENLGNKFENECNYQFTLFKYALYVYYRTQGYSNDSPEIKKLQDNGIVEAAIEAVGLVSGIGSFLIKSLDSLAAHHKENVIKNMDVIKRLDNMSSEDISEQIIKLFIKELREQTEKEAAPVVVFLDTYEQLQNYVYQISSAKVSEEWLWSRTGVIRRIPNIIWVLAGQRKVDWGQFDSFWRDESNILYEEIGEIKETDRIREMLTKIGIVESDIVDTILEQTKGVPVHLALCKDTYFNLKMAGITPTVADFDMDYTQLAKRFIGGLSSELKDIVDVLACLETWTQDDIVQMNFSADSYRHIIQLSFIKKDADRYYMHKSVQEIVYKTCSPIIQKKCLQYFERMLTDTSVTTADKKDYILKKIRLQAGMLEGMQGEKHEEEAKQFVKEVMQCTREYLSDYNFFSKMKNILRSDSLAAYIDEVDNKKLDIYSVYHSSRNGESAAVRNYIKSGKVYDNKGLDNTTKGLLFITLGSYELENEHYGFARTYLMEAYKMLETTGDLYVLLDILCKLASVCYKQEKYTDVHYYCDMGLNMISKEKMNTQLVDQKCAYLIQKARASKLERQYNEYLKRLAEAEELLKSYVNLIDMENDGIVRGYVLIYSEYFYHYQARGNQELADKYLRLLVDCSKKAYELKASDTNYRNLAITYREIAENTKDMAMREEYFDKCIAIMWELYQEFATSARLHDVFYSTRMAIDCTDGEKRDKYINACNELLANPKEFPVRWKDIFFYHRALFLAYRKEEDWDKAESKMAELEHELEKQKDKLSEDDYQDYLIWNYRERGKVYEKQGKYYDAIRIWEKEHKLEMRRYERDDSAQQSKAYAVVCSRLGRAYYIYLKLQNKAIYYLEKSVEISSKIPEEYPAMDILELCSTSIYYLNIIYKKRHEYQKVLEFGQNIRKLLLQRYEQSKRGEWLFMMSNILTGRASVQVLIGQADSALEEYSAFLDLIEKKEYVIFDVKHDIELNRAVDLMKCQTACLLYTQDKDLEKARTYLLNAQCPYTEFDKYARDFYLAKIENRILQNSFETTFLTKEEGLELLKQA